MVVERKLSNVKLIMEFYYLDAQSYLVMRDQEFPDDPPLILPVSKGEELEVFEWYERVVEKHKEAKR